MVLGKTLYRTCSNERVWADLFNHVLHSMIIFSARVIKHCIARNSFLFRSAQSTPRQTSRIATAISTGGSRCGRSGRLLGTTTCIMKRRLVCALMDRRGMGGLPQPLPMTDVWHVERDLGDWWRHQHGDSEHASCKFLPVDASDPNALDNFFEDHKESTRIVINHRRQYKFAASNFRALFGGHITGPWGGSRIGAVSAPDMHSMPHKNSYPWVKDVLTRGSAIPGFDPSCMKLLTRKWPVECNDDRHQHVGKSNNDATDVTQNLVLISSHHASHVHSRRVERLLKRWKPDTVVLEIDPRRLDNQLQKPSARFSAWSCALAAGTAALVYWDPSTMLPLSSVGGVAYGAMFTNKFYSDMAVAARTAKDVGANLIAADWSWESGRSDVTRIARLLDRLQYANQKDLVGDREFFNMNSFGWNMRRHQLHTHDCMHPVTSATHAHAHIHALSHNMACALRHLLSSTLVQCGYFPVILLNMLTRIIRHDHKFDRQHDSSSDCAKN